MAGEQSGLYLQHTPHGDTVSEQRMRGYLFQPALERRDQCLSTEQVHFGHADQVIAGREAVLREAWAAHPDRFVSGEPKPKPLPEAVWINPPTPSLTTQEIAL